MEEGLMHKASLHKAGGIADGMKHATSNGQLTPAASLPRLHRWRGTATRKRGIR